MERIQRLRYETFRINLASAYKGYHLLFLPSLTYVVVSTALVYDISMNVIWL